MADGSKSPGDFSFMPTPTSMSPNHFWGMLQSFTPEKRAMAGQYFRGNCTPTLAGTRGQANTPERFVPVGTPESGSSLTF